MIEKENGRGLSVFILDTDTLTLLWRGQEKVAEKVRRLGGTLKIPLAITWVTHYEKLNGRFEQLFKSANQAELEQAIRKLDETLKQLKSLTVVEFDDRVPPIFDQLRRHKLTKKMGRRDMLIACVALAYNAILVTRNTKDYVNVPNLKLQNWAD